jgi:3-oxoacyl-[acyl-carrier-protein] synthase-3
MGLRIIDSALSIPKKVVTNDDLTKILDTSDEWISKRTGIKQRYQAVEETTSSMAIEVAKQLLEKSKTDPSEIDLIVVATMSPDYMSPSVAAIVQGSIDATNAMAFDISAACSGFVYGMSIVNNMLHGGKFKKAILIGAEKLTRLLDWTDRSTAVLFGDAAAGILAENDSLNSSYLINEKLNTYGNMGQYLTAGNVAALDDPAQSYFFQMNGRKVYEFATKRVPESILTVLHEANIDPSEVKYFLLHQANERIVKSVAKKLDLSMDKFPVNIGRFGNTAAASEPVLLAEMLADGKINRGDIIVFSGFGGGLTVGTNVIKY